MTYEINTPISDEVISKLNVGDTIYISGEVYCGRDAVLPRIVKMIEDGSIADQRFDLHGAVIFHTAVSVSGVGPTSSNKFEIESSIALLSKYGVKLHLGKGALHKETVEALNEYNAVYAVIPPVTALLGDKTSDCRVAAFPEEGMEALHVLKADRYPAIIAAAHGRSIYD